MQFIKSIALSITCFLLFTSMAFSQKDNQGWISLFDGKTLNYWKVGDNAETFSVSDGRIVVHGKTAHLFYVGPVEDHRFKNFEFKAQEMTMPGANSGIY